MENSTVSAELEVRLDLPEQGLVPLVACLFYSRQDPYAVRVAFEVGLDQPVEWVFARDLLARGTRLRVGLGDVRLWPSAGSAGRAPGGVLHIALSSPSGHAHIEAPRAEISDFLRRAYQVVPAGEESEHMDIESELHHLLRQPS